MQVRARLAWGATGLGLVALCAALGVADPAALGGPDLCLFHRATGLACPACGMTRAAAALARGDLAASLAWHPLFLLVAAEIAGAWLLWGGNVWLARPLPRRAIVLVTLATAGLLLAVWAVRWASGRLPP